FLFSFTLITGLLFLNTIAQRLDQLTGKGLPWTVLGQFALLALPHTVALTLPMSVLVAVLFAFSDLTAENEITAMTSGGVNPIRLLLPMVGIGVILAGGMFLFNDRVLPETNHALRKLLVDINLKDPTFQLREQVLNQINADDPERGTRTFFLSAVHIDPLTSTLQDVIISDVSDPAARRTTYADQGTMVLSADQTNMFLTLKDGIVLEIPRNQKGYFRRYEFANQFLPIRGISNIFQEGAESQARGDREMSTGELADSAKLEEEASLRFRKEMKEEAVVAVKRALGWRMVGGSLIPPSNEVGRSRDLVLAEDPLPPDEITRGVALGTRVNHQQAEYYRLNAIEKRVEIHKKYAIAFACIVFVLLGAPLAVRFPRGGVGMVITASVAIFAVFWACLIGGETLADDGYISPALAMWFPNILLLPLGLYLTKRISKQVATARGGGWDDLLFTVFTGLRRPFKRLTDRRTA
ncbi:MAG: LptF/LptG family permease, partial [Gemmatimonadetes bacterium]|nr:LptF/LptG family permease [Gemmatimonadota bacterium]